MINRLCKLGIPKCGLELEIMDTSEAILPKTYELSTVHCPQPTTTGQIPNRCLIETGTLMCGSASRIDTIALMVVGWSLLQPP